MKTGPSSVNRGRRRSQALVLLRTKPEPPSKGEAPLSTHFNNRARSLLRLISFPPTFEQSRSRSFNRSVPLTLSTKSRLLAYKNGMIVHTTHHHLCSLLQVAELHLQLVLLRLGLRQGQLRLGQLPLHLYVCVCVCVCVSVFIQFDELKCNRSITARQHTFIHARK